MMKTLLLMRHAKSDWKDSDLSDHERPLNERGSKTAPQMGQYIHSKGLNPDLIISSSALRAKETAQKIAQTVHYSNDILIKPELYSGRVSDYLKVIQEIDNDYQIALIVAHNPTIEEFINHLFNRPERVPTSTIAVFKFNLTDWKKIEINTTPESKLILRPKEVLKP